MSYYIIRIAENGEQKYFFNKRTLLYDPELSKHFNSLEGAKRALRTSMFKDSEHKFEKFGDNT